MFFFQCCQFQLIRKKINISANLKSHPIKWFDFQVLTISNDIDRAECYPIKAWAERYPIQWQCTDGLVLLDIQCNWGTCILLEVRYLVKPNRWSVILHFRYLNIILTETKKDSFCLSLIQNQQCERRCCILLSISERTILNCSTKIKFQIEVWPKSKIA